MMSLSGPAGCLLKAWTKGAPSFEAGAARLKQKTELGNTRAASISLASVADQSWEQSLADGHGLPRWSSASAC
ncbi:hypothetical protein EUGRSUZ_E01995 [Eucalyptus grandis]|uniref:Uncharacterized protein n=2 Tax=Eucalyptus grandis TaxID=71139 RepID=A0ACC3KW54_EUCGR|nr:hypothetical protein EUGRSUZ_E01995 [Eucalyptus grandis]